MNKLAAKIFRVDSTHFNEGSSQYFIDQLIDKHNLGSPTTKYKKVDTKVKNEHFDVTLFVHQPSASPPAWKGILLEITGNHTDVKNIKSMYPSFILFFHNDKEIFIISGGAGYRAVESVFDSHFGFNVVERLIDTSSDELRGISQRVFLGVELAANRFFKADYVFNDEDSFGKYYRSLEVFINNDKLKSIGVETPKKKLLVKGELGFKIDSKISFEEMINRVKKISDLLKEKTDIELNPFKRVTDRELKKVLRNSKTFEQLLNQHLCQSYFDEYSSAHLKEIYHPKLMEFLKCSEIQVKWENKDILIETYQRITPRLILGMLEIEEVKFPKFLDLVNQIEILIVEEESSKKLYPSKLIDWFHGEISIDNDRFLKFENEWFRYSINFSNDLDQRLSQISDNLEIYELQPWTTEYGTEGDYNLSFKNNKKFIVGDKVLYKNIEIADLITWENDQLIIIHLKDGLDKNLRVLQSQIINSAKILSELRSKTLEDSDELLVYYKNLQSSSIKFKTQLPDFEEFNKIIHLKKIKFVFGFGTTGSYTQKEDIIDEILRSKSIIAKISVLHAFYSIRNMSYNFSIAKVVKSIK